MDYPSVEEERRIARETTGSSVVELNEVIDGPTLQQYQSLVERVTNMQHTSHVRRW